MKSAVANSSSSDASEAGNEAMLAAKRKLESEPDLIYLFASSKYNQQDLLKSVHGQAPSANIVGASTGGEISAEGESTEGVVIMAIDSQTAEISTGVGLDISVDAKEAGRQAARNALNGLSVDHLSVEQLSNHGDGWQEENHIDMSVFSTTLTGNGSDIARGISDILSSGFKIAGGMAGDDWQLENTYVYHNGEVLIDSVVAVAISGPHSRGIGRKHGLQRTEHTYNVTKSDVDVVKELDGEPPAEVYQDLFGDKADSAQFLMTKPLGMQAGEDSLRIRDPLIINDDGSIVFAGEVEEGTRVTIMEAQKDNVIDAAQDAARQAYEDANEPDEIGGVILNDCVCRWSCLETPEKRDQEIQAIRDVVGEETPIVGFYTYGEFAMPSTLAGVHNQTMVIQLFGEE